MSRLLHQLRGLISVDPGDVKRRDLADSRQSEVQLELDLLFQNLSDRENRRRRVESGMIDLSIS
ncbi:hypothetical protein [Brevifollis gellanilyticus]|uniref:hypothetical protein n=1 Tax=Brevifollis gellanilyticus TaxID=748831 RepID=UPI0011BF8047|nr:hypothetical protein [Brevifollis gellanilyticus]